MTVHDIFELVNYISGRHPSGAAITPSRFNILLPQCNMEYYDSELRKGLKPDSPLYVFKQTPVTVTADQNGLAQLPGDFGHLLSAVTTFSGQNNTGIPRGRTIEPVTDTEFHSRQNSITSRQNKPFGRLQGAFFEVRPKNVEDILIDYLRLPANPYMDYCQSAVNPNIIYFMPVGSTLVESSVQGRIDLLVGTSRTLNVSKAGVTGNAPDPLYTSATTELEWNEKNHYHLVYRILVKIGVNLSEDLVTKYAMEASQ